MDDVQETQLLHDDVLIMKNKLFALAIFFTPFCHSEEINISEIERSLKSKETFVFDLNHEKNSEKYKDSLSKSIEDSIKNSHEIKDAIEKFSKTINSQEFKEAQEKWTENLAETMKIDLPPQKKDSDALIPYSGKPILFASRSIPMGTLRQYAADLEKVGGLIVIRGFIGGVSQLKPTIRFVDEILKKDTKCKIEPCERFKTSVSVDPIIFREYGIKSVPALAVHGVTNLRNYCNGTDGLNISKNVAYGDYSIEHLIGALAEKGKDQDAIELRKSYEKKL